MSFATFSLARAAAACACLCLVAGASGARAASPAAAQDKPKQEQPKVSNDERKAEKKVKDAQGVAAKFAAATEFVRKHPQSSLRPGIAFELAKAISEVPDLAQRVTHAEQFLNTFTNANETAVVYPVLIGAYVFSGRAEDAFNAAPTLLETTPDEAYVLYLLTIAGANEAQRGNSKFLQQSLQYSQNAIRLFEANQRPASVVEEEWNQNRTTWLSQLYQSSALLALSSNKAADAQAALTKAAALTPNDPMVYYVLAGTKNDEYQKLVQQTKIAPAGAAQDAARKTAEAKLDEVIELYARVLALSEGQERYKPMRDQTLQDMTTYYKFRHNNSTAGMQELINKYKTAPATP
ncbi:MAG TPA: hypothetical protein VER08_04175 [Pyrinomonadaceae bacterium]|nr:hypothetical protein [Pyrinomonadaceae bacterium]